MREIGRIVQEQAAVISDYLILQGIHNELELRVGGLTSIWVHREDQLAPARELLARFLAAPGDASWRQASTSAQQLRQRTVVEDAKRDANIRTPAEGWRGRTPVLVTLVLVSLSIGITLLSNFTQDLAVTNWLHIESWRGAGSDQDGWFHDVLHGQIWRLVTPIFLHVSLLHLFGNMTWMVSIGSMIERRQGWRSYLLLVSVIAVLANCAQYLYAGPNFAGMSGVVYGVFGYAWMRSMLEPGGGYQMGRADVIMSLAWFVLCCSGAVGPIGNAAHGAGLVLGVFWGVLSVRKVRQRIRGIFGSRPG